MAQRLYACYTEVCGPDGRRAQFVLVPPRPQLFNNMTTGGRVEAFYWHRTQARAGHRAVWRWTELTPDLERQLLATVTSLSLLDGWAPGPVIPVELTLLELCEYIADRKTPYPVLRRAKQLARRNFDYEVAV